MSGFLCRADYERVLQEMRLADGSVWPLPVCLDVSETFAAKLDSDEAVQDNRATSSKPPAPSC
uniref:hypothetical protein n=1 Tax=Candidatus Electronema sp. TaxID=2698783 RepID=UPI004055CCA2